MSDEDPARLELLRKYAAIYGRFDSKRKSEKPMSLHEVRKIIITSINLFTIVLEVNVQYYLPTFVILAHLSYTTN